MQNPDGAQVAEQSQTTTFVDPSHSEVYSHQERNLAPFAGDTQEHLDLADFLKRPTKIYTTSWSGGFTSTTLDPWTLFFSNIVIKNKIQNFGYFSGNLHVRFVINTNPFLYGSLLVNYQPMYAQTNQPTSLNQLVTHSQLPHILLEPQVNDSGELMLPFVYQKQFLELTDASAVASMGRLNLVSLAALASASETYSGAITITAYAWVDEPRLFGPTTKLALQGGDEYGNGPVSAPAAALSRFATQFSSMPVIGKWATATSIGASAVSSIAKLFGWSNVPVIEDVKPFKPMYYHDLASAHISEPVSKVTLDPKAELSVDPSIIGASSEDGLAISKIATHESYLWSSQWNSTGVQGDTLFASVVSPRLFVDQGADANGTQTLLFTPQCMLSELFSHWRGDIIFKFRFITSKFHRGRVLISFDPLGDLSGITDTVNTTISKVVDIGETTEYEFRVPYMQALPWLACTKSVTMSSWFSDTATVPPIVGSGNGTIAVRILNALTAPRATSSVYMQVWVRGADNLEFANPSEISLGLFPWQLQGGEEESHPCPDRYRINWGEPIPSLRLLTRRSTYLEPIQMAAAGTSTNKSGYRIKHFSRLPIVPGYGQGALTAKSVASASQIAYTYAKFTPLHFISRCFLGNRGSIRYHFMPSFAASRTNMTVVRQTGDTVSDSDINVFTGLTTRASAGTTKDCAAAIIRNDPSQSNPGLVATDTLMNPALSLECPMMTNYLYSFNKLDTWAKGNTNDGTNLDNYALIVYDYPGNGTTVDNYIVNCYVSAGTDFNLFYFLCVPPLYYNVNGGKAL